MGECTKSYLLTLLYKQNLFHKNIQYFVVHGLRNIDYPQPLSDTKAPSPQPNEQDSDPHKKAMEVENDDLSKS